MLQILLILYFLNTPIFAYYSNQPFVPIGRDYHHKRRPFVIGNTPHRVMSQHSAEEERIIKMEERAREDEEIENEQRAAKRRQYQEYFEKMRQYAIISYKQRYNNLLAKQAQEKAQLLTELEKYGGIPSSQITREQPYANTDDAARPSSPFGTSEDDRRNRQPAVTTAHRRPTPEEMREVCMRYASTVKKHCYKQHTERRFVPRCQGYFRDCQRYLPHSDPLYAIANSFSSGVGLNLGVDVNGIPYYPINEEGSIGVGYSANAPFGSWGGGYSQNIGVRDYWSQTLEAGGNWYEGKYGYKSGWSVPLVQSLGVEGESHATVSVPLKPGEAGKPIGVDVGGGVGPYYQQNQHVGVDYMNGQVNTGFGVGVPLAGVGVNTGLGIKFPGINDFGK